MIRATSSTFQTVRDYRVRTDSRIEIAHTKSLTRKDTSLREHHDHFGVNPSRQFAEKFLFTRSRQTASPLLNSSVQAAAMSDPLLFPVPSALETRRLVLRSFRLEDAPALHEALAESIGQLRSNLWFLPWVIEEPTLQSAQIRCRMAEANFLLRTDLPFVAFEKATGRLVGSIGLHRTDWDTPKTEVGYWVRTSETGKGYASEGVLALTSWAFQTLHAKRVELVTDERNVGSRAVAERCGFTLEGILHNVMKAPDGGLRNSCVYAMLPAAA